MADSKSISPFAPRKPAPLREGQSRLVLTAGSLKVTLVLDPEELATMPPPTGTGPVPFIAAAGGMIAEAGILAQVKPERPVR